LVAQCQEETYIAAVRRQSLPVSVDLFRDASTVMSVLERDLRTAIASHAAGNLGTWPTPARLLLGLDAPSTGSKHTRSVSPAETPSKKVRQESKKDAAKSGQSPATTKSGANKDSKLGMLEYYGPSTSAPPLIGDVFHKKGNAATAERLCGHFLVQGFQCTKGPSCVRPHVASLQALPEDVRSKLVAFVNKSEVLKFAPGKGPAGK
jgi:hypothetical protein